MNCQKCNQLIKESSLHDDYCQECWELLCSQSWWDLIIKTIENQEE